MEDREIARLLSGRNEPSVLEKEAGFEKVMRTVERDRRRPGWLMGGVLALAAAALFVVLRPGSQPENEFGARGDGKRQLSLLCVPPADATVTPAGEGSHCVSGGKLAFDVMGTEGTYFAAFARRSDGTIVWYWPAPEGRSLPVVAFADKRAPHTAVMLDRLHPPGDYEVFGVFSKQPLDRARLKRVLGDDLRGDGSVQVVRRGFSVQAP